MSSNSFNVNQITKKTKEKKTTHTQTHRHRSFALHFQRGLMLALIIHVPQTFQIWDANATVKSPPSV